MLMRNICIGFWSKQRFLKFKLRLIWCLCPVACKMLWWDERKSATSVQEQAKKPKGTTEIIEFGEVKSRAFSETCPHFVSLWGTLAFPNSSWIIKPLKDTTQALSLSLDPNLHLNAFVHQFPEIFMFFVKYSCEAVRERASPATPPSRPGTLLTGPFALPDGFGDHPAWFA